MEEERISVGGNFTKKYSEDLITAILKAWDNGLRSSHGIARMLTNQGWQCTRGGVQSTLDREGRMSLYNPENVEAIRSEILTGETHQAIAGKLGFSLTFVDNVSAKLNVERRRLALQPLPDQVKKDVATRIAMTRDWGPGRYMILADPHVKFHSLEAFEMALAHKGDFDGCVICGDLLDEYWISFFRKECKSTYAAELATALEMLDQLVKRFSRVLYIHGNHEDRRWKRMMDVAKPVLDLVGPDEKEQAAKDFFDIMERVRGWHNNEVPNVQVHTGWFADICKGKIIVSHPDRFMSVPGNAAKAVVEHMYNMKKDYRLEPIDALLMGHGHRLDGPKNRIGVWTWELPAMCPLLPYQTGPRASNSGTVDTGYSVITTRPDGTLRFNESRSYLVGGS